MTVKIPSTIEYFGVEKIFTRQLNTSTVLGDLVATFNIDLTTNFGKIRVSPRGMLNTNTTSIATAFKPYNNNTASVWYAITRTGTTGACLSKSSSLNPSSSFTADTSTGAPSNIDVTKSDMELFNGKLYVTSGNSTSIYILNGGTWSTITPTIDTGSPHMLNAFNNRLYISNALTNVISCDVSNTFAYTSGGGQNQISIAGYAAGLSITFIKSAQNRIFIGTVNTNGGRGYVFVWDGIDPVNFDKVIELKSPGAMACVVMDDVPYIMDAHGVLRQ